MRALAAVFVREVQGRRLVFPVALAAGLMPIVGSLVNGWSRPGEAEGRVAVALVAAAAFSFAFAILFGGSVIAGETSEKRISFFFSRPLPVSAIWGGKLLAVLFLTFVPAGLALLPAFVASTTSANKEVIRLGGAPGAVLGLFLVTLFAILGAHAAVTIARLRSPWIALDALFAGLWAVGVALSARSLLRDGLLPRPQLLSSPPFWAFFALVTFCLLAATSVQVAVGRTDARRAHGAFSATLWSLLGIAVFALGGFAAWVASARTTDLASIAGGVLAAPRGAWVAAGGPLRAGRGAGLFLVDTAGTRFLRIRSEGVAFSANGERAAWTEERIGFFESERKSDLFVADLSAAKAVETGLTTSVWSRTMLSPSGRRLAVFDDGTLSVYEISDPANARQIMALRIEKTSRALAFVGDDTVRMFPQPYSPPHRSEIAPRELEIEEVSLLSKKSLVTGHIEPGVAHLRVRMSADGRFLVGTRDKRLTLHDGRTGALHATLSEDLSGPKLRFLSGDRLVVAGVSDGKGILKIFLEGGKSRSASPPPLSVDLGPAASVVLGGEIAPGRVAVAISPFQRNPSFSESLSAWKLSLVDVATGAVSPGPDGLVPADRLAWWFSHTLPPAEAGSPASYLFLDADSRLVRLEPATGARTVLLGRSK